MTINLDEHVPFLLYRAASKLASEANAELKTLGINTMCSRILLVLLRDTHVTVGDLCQATSIDQSTVSHTLIKLGRNGLVTKQRQLRDNRTVRVSLTPKGMLIARRCTDISTKNNRIAVEGLSRNQIATLRAMLRHLYENLTHVESAAAVAE
jgi:MarR family transcriptional regulator, organic hydroperoxide resistance regulator